MSRSPAQTKRKLRDLKRLEIQLRFYGDAAKAQGRLVWDEFFSTNASQQPCARYDLDTIQNMGRERFKEILEEYFYNIYFQIFREQGLSGLNFYDPRLLGTLGLPAGASAEQIKSRFRQLAKKYHPDLGGEADKFIELMQVYERLTGDG